MEEFEKVRPQILGALLDGLCAAVRNYKQVRLAEIPRMADFAVWASAAESGLGLESGSFERAYKAFRLGAVREALDADPVAIALEAFMEGQEQWKGSATALLDELGRFAEGKVTQSQSWPKAANKLSERLDRLGSSLRKVGLDVRKAIEGHESKKVIMIDKARESTVGGDGNGAPSVLRNALIPDDPSVGTVALDGR